MKTILWITAFAVWSASLFAQGICEDARFQIQGKTVFGTEYFKHEDSVGAVAVSPAGDGGVAFVSAQEKKLVFWDSATGERIKTLEKALYGIAFLAFSPDGGKLAFEDSC
jgi:hypothetical protein